MSRRRNSLRSALLKLRDRLISAFKRLFDLIRDIDKLKRLYGELTEEKNKRSLKLLLGEIKKLLLEMKPRKGEGYLELGLSDPYETGRAMEIAALLYPFYESFFEVRPDFYEERAEGEIKARGRLRMIVVLRSLIRIYRDKNLMRIIRKFAG